jgi:rod shape-determining protein MreD
MNGTLVSTSREEIEVHRFSLGVSIGIPVLAMFLQVWLPHKIRFMGIFDLPLLVTIFFAVARRRQIPGMLIGGLMGTFQDAFTNHPIGVFGISKTIIGFFASSIGVKLDVENPGSRFLMTFGFYFLHQIIYVVIDRGLVGVSEPWAWAHTLLGAFANGLLAVVLFAGLDRFKGRR